MLKQVFKFVLIFALLGLFAFQSFADPEEFIFTFYLDDNTFWEDPVTGVRFYTDIEAGTPVGTSGMQYLTTGSNVWARVHVYAEGITYTAISIYTVHSTTATHTTIQVEKEAFLSGSPIYQSGILGFPDNSWGAGSDCGGGYNCQNYGLTGFLNTETDDWTFAFRRRSSAGSGSISINSITVTYLYEPLAEGAYYRPLNSVDRHAFGYIENTLGNPTESQFTTIDFATNSGLVHVLADGFIEEIRLAKESDCALFLDPVLIPSRPCSIWIDENTTGELDYTWALNGQNAWSITPLTDDLMNFYYVRIDITGDDRDAIYFVEKAPSFITEGTFIEAGCVIGRTIGKDGSIYWSDSDDNEGSISPNTWVDVAILALVDETNTIVDAKDEILLDPPKEKICRNDEGFSGCLGDSLLEDESQWESIGANFTPAFVALEPGGFIQTKMNLDSESMPELIIYAATNGGLNFEAQLGQTIEIFSTGGGLVGTSYQDYVIEADEHEPDSGSLYTIRIENLSQFYSMAINFICVRHTEGEDLPSPSGDVGKCEFLNYDFRYASQDWTTTGDANFVQGAARLTSGATIYQTISSEPGDYYLAVTFSTWGDKPPPEDTTSDIELEYEYPASDGFETIGTWTSQQMAMANNLIVTQTPITISTESTVTIKPTVSGNPWGSSATILGITIKSICLYPTTGTGPFVEKCAPIAAPTNEALSDWTSWHWHNLDQFFQCDLMILLNKMYSLLFQQYRTIGWIQRYWMAMSHQGLQWSGARLFPWLAGYLSNIAPSNITVLNAPSCDNIWCVFVGLFDTINSGLTGLFDTLNNIVFLVVVPILEFIITWLNVALNLLLAVVLGLINLALIALAQMIDLVITLKNWLYAIIYAWNNATPEVLPGLWDCVNSPEDNAVCWGLWVAENTIFSGTYGALILPLFVSLAYIMIAISWVKRFRAVIMQVGEAL